MNVSILRIHFIGGAGFLIYELKKIWYAVVLFKIPLKNVSAKFKLTSLQNMILPLNK